MSREIGTKRAMARYEAAMDALADALQEMAVRDGLTLNKEERNLLRDAQEKIGWARRSLNVRRLSGG